MKKIHIGLPVIAAVLIILITGCHTQLGTLESDSSPEASQPDPEGYVNNWDDGQSYYFIDYATQEWFRQRQASLSNGYSNSYLVFNAFNTRRASFYTLPYYYEVFYTSPYSVPYCTASACYRYSVNRLGYARGFWASNLFYDSSANYDPSGRFDPLGLYNFTLANNRSYTFYRQFYYGNWASAEDYRSKVSSTVEGSGNNGENRTSGLVATSERRNSNRDVNRRSHSNEREFASSDDLNSPESNPIRSRRSSIGDKENVSGRTSGIQSRGRNSGLLNRRSYSNKERNASGERSVRTRTFNSDEDKSRRTRGATERRKLDVTRQTVEPDATVLVTRRAISSSDNSVRAKQASRVIIEDRVRTVMTPVSSGGNFRNRTTMRYETWLKDVASQYSGNRSDSYRMRNSQGKNGNVTRSSTNRIRSNSTIRSRSSSSRSSGSTIKRTRSSSSGGDGSRSRSSSSGSRSSGNNN